MSDFEHGPSSDRQITERWGQAVLRRGELEIQTSKGIQIRIVGKTLPTRNIEYRAYLPSGQEVAWMYCKQPRRGVVQITNANVYEVGDDDYRQKGIGTMLYDLIEHDVVEAGGQGIEPQWDALSDDAVDFWKKRRPDLADELELHRPAQLPDRFHAPRDA